MSGATQEIPGRCCSSLCHSCSGTVTTLIRDGGGSGGGYGGAKV